MEFGAHLPLIDFGDSRRDMQLLRAYASAAHDLGYAWLTANDHLIFPRAWLDGPTALAAVIDNSGSMTLATTLALPAIRGPLATAKALSAIDILSGGRLVAGVGPGSSAYDYSAVGVSFDERWKRLAECVHVTRAFFRGESFTGTFYSTGRFPMEPKPDRGGPPIWLGSWGSEAGTRRVAHLADGWLASAYNTTPADFARAKGMLDEELNQRKRDARAFPNAIATAWMYITEERAEEERVLTDVIGRLLNRPVDTLREQLLVGPPDRCAELLSAYAAAGAERVLVWPVRNELRQLEIFRARVAPLVR